MDGEVLSRDGLSISRIVREKGIGPPDICEGVNNARLVSKAIMESLYVCYKY